jgi:replicative DNA helicase
MTLYDESTISALKDRMPEYLETVCGIDNLRRPFRCLSPAHEDRHPSMSYDRRTNNVHCFSCGSGGDVFEVAGWIEGAVSFPDKVEAVARAVGYPLQTYIPMSRKKPVRAPQKPAYGKPQPLGGRDLMGVMQQAMRALQENPQAKVALDYLHRRGLDDGLIADSFIGWVGHPSALFPSMRAPLCNTGYIVLGFPAPAEGATTEPEATPNHVAVPYAVFRMCKAGAEPKELKPSDLIAPLWREHLLTGTSKLGAPVYVTEGIFDAMSLTALIGTQACAICGSNTTRLLQVMAHTPKENRPYLILSFDSDEAGKGYTETATKGLKMLGIPHSIAKPYPHGCKDANELLMRGRGCHER